MQKKENNKMEKQEKQLTDKNGNPIEIHPFGSLELLALGDIGLLAWRQKRREVKKTGSKENNKND